MAKKEPKDTKKLDRLLSLLEKKKYTVKKASEVVVEDKLRTGIYPLDYVLDGGFVQSLGGHMVEFYGAESSGKTTFALIVLAQYQREGKVCMYINAENSYDPKWATSLGVDNDNLIILEPKSLEDAGNVLIEAIPHTDLIIIDSIVALIPEEEMAKDLQDKSMASQSKVISPMTRKIYRAIKDYKTSIIFINQLREKVGQRYGNPETTGGGRALKHMYHTRIRFKTAKPIRKGSGEKQETIGMEIDLWAKKNKKGVAYRKGTVTLNIDGTTDNKKTLLFGAIKYGVVGFSGKTYTYKKDKAVGEGAMLEMLTDKDCREIQEAIWKRIK